MRLIGAIATGETASADEQADALSVLNQMLDSWSNENLIINAKIKEEFPLVGGQQIYTMGPSGNFNTTRPLRIDMAYIKQSGSTTFELPVEIVTVEQWADIGVKNTQSSIPTKLYPEMTSTLVNLNLWPVPSAATTLVLYSIKTLTSFANATDSVTLPPGYEKALRYGLAVELAPEFGKSLDPVLVEQMNEAKANIKRINSKPQFMDCDSAILSRANRFNWLTGE